MTRTIAMSCVTVLALMSAGHGADLDPDKVTRLYATHFRNTVIGGDKFWSNGVQASPTMTFFDTYLEFYSGQEYELSDDRNQRVVARLPRSRSTTRAAPGSRGRKIACNDKDYHCPERSDGDGAAKRCDVKGSAPNCRHDEAQGDYVEALKDFEARRGK